MKKLAKLTRFKDGETTFLEIPKGADATAQLNYFYSILGTGWNWEEVKRSLWVKIQLHFHNKRITRKLNRLELEVKSIGVVFPNVSIAEEYRRLNKIKSISKIIDNLRQQQID